MPVDVDHDDSGFWNESLDVPWGCRIALQSGERSSLNECTYRIKLEAATLPRGPPWVLLRARPDGLRTQAPRRVEQFYELAIEIVEPKGRAREPQAEVDRVVVWEVEVDVF